MKRLVFASGNKHKVGEIAAMLAPRGWQVEPLSLTVDEDAATFAGNAEKKARAALAKTGLPSLADDSGLEVDALGGAPGVAGGEKYHVCTGLLVCAAMSFAMRRSVPSTTATVPPSITVEPQPECLP